MPKTAPDTTTSKPTSEPEALLSEQIVMQCLSDLMATNDVGSVINKILADIGNTFEADRVRLFTLDRDKTILETTHEWTAEDKESFLDTWRTTSTDQVPWMMNQLWATNPVIIPETKAITSSEADQDWWQRQDIQSLIAIPLPIKRSLGGFIQIDGVQAVNHNDIVNLQKIAQGLGSQLSRKGTSVGSGVDAEGKYRVIFESVDDGIIAVSKSGVVEDVNRKVCELFGKEPAFFQGKYLKDLIGLFPEGSLNNIVRNLGYSRMMGMKIPPSEVPYTTPNGDTKVLDISASALLDQGAVAGSLVVVRDITFRKGMETAVQESETRLRTVLDAVKEGITLSDSNGQFLIYNPEMEELTGYSKQEANAAADFLSLIQPDARKRSQVLEFLSTFEIGDQSTSETTIQSKDGRAKHLLVSTTLISHGSDRLYLTAYHDVTQMKQFQEQLEQRNTKLEDTTKELNQTAEALKQARDNLEEKVIEKTKELRAKVDEVENLAKFPSEDPFPVLRVNNQGVLLYANQASADLLKFWNCREGEVLPDGWTKMVSEVFETNSRRIMEAEFASQFLSFVLVPIKSGNYVNMYGRDVTKEKEVERMKNEFIAMVSHQIRTPLTSLRWYSEMLIKDEQMTEDQTEIADTIHDTAVNLAGLVTDLLSISRLESGRLDSKPERTSIVELLKEEHKKFAAQAQAKQQNYLLNIDESIEDFMFDPKLIREVFSNLISNAIKYTPVSGTVTVNLKKEEDKVLAEVIDSGIGIPKDAQESIFSRFYRAQNAVDTEVEGTGLGLSVAKMMVEKCGGTIWFNSEEGKGTTFSFTLPVALT